VHRLLEKELKKGKLTENDLSELKKMTRHTTDREIAAAEAERDSVKLKQVEYMSAFVGKEFEGVISGITEWGIYVQEKETLSEGMVSLRDLSDDFYEHDPKTYSLRGQRTKKTYRLGDTVTFKILRADIERKTLDFSLISKK
jgi:ribonuclease R